MCQSLIYSACSRDRHADFASVQRLLHKIETLQWGIDFGLDRGADCSRLVTGRDVAGLFVGSDRLSRRRHHRFGDEAGIGPDRALDCLPDIGVIA
jgi:hypothetical protein